MDTCFPEHLEADVRWADFSNCMSADLYRTCSSLLLISAAFLNLGGEGQFIMGAVTSIFVSAKLGDAGMGGLSCKPFFAGTVAGASGALFWYFKDHQGLNEMIVSIMLNYVATLFMGYVYTTLLRDGSVPQNCCSGRQYEDCRYFKRISSPLGCSWRRFLLAAVLYYFIFYTSKGFKLRAVGMNATAAFFNGFSR